MTSRATPEPAKQLWDEAVAAHGRPSLREIAGRLRVAPSTVMRWKRNDWVGTERRYLPPANLAIEARVSEVVEKTKVKLDELKEAIAALVGGKEELTKLLVAPTQELLEELERLNLVTMIAAQHMVQASLTHIPARDLGMFGNSVASALMRTAAAANLRKTLPTPTPDGYGDADSQRLIEHDDLDPAWAAMRKLMANPPADCPECRRRAQGH